MSFMAWRRHEDALKQRRDTAEEERQAKSCYSQCHEMAPLKVGCVPGVFDCQCSPETRKKIERNIEICIETSCSRRPPQANNCPTGTAAARAGSQVDPAALANAAASLWNSLPSSISPDMNSILAGAMASATPINNFGTFPTSLNAAASSTPSESSSSPLVSTTEPESHSTAISPVPIIVGSILGFFSLIGLGVAVIVAFYLARKRRRARRAAALQQGQPFGAGPTNPYLPQTPVTWSPFPGSPSLTQTSYEVSGQDARFEALGKEPLTQSSYVPSPEERVYEMPCTEAPTRVASTTASTDHHGSGAA
ncbi:hypothetical protein HIM_05303 [Hirsutella minnesotensis 3608]|uniref:Uncharacterized protein n=1 Tax=Hirsutella minnesotensis 3608 TaxID=1043627 RepID=A0A0F8A0J0_9HYPO|nr:hypothetical protein HIM_05303 [Hirsutella minnesotensis 3608]